MDNLKAKLKNISAFILDIDGVLTNGMVLTLENGEQLRQMNIKDGFAIQYAIKQEYVFAIISGGKSESVRKRLNGLGIQEVHLACKNKMEVFNSILEKYNLKKEEVLYMGDDIPDYEILKQVGFAACPSNAASEIKEASHYVSSKNGGEGCVRDLIEQVLRLQGKWVKLN